VATPSFTKNVSINDISSPFVIVRMDLNVGKYTTTQEMFLAKVGITNSYQEDNLNLCQPFFVILMLAKT
jgi:hypothetical protein